MTRNRAILDPPRHNLQFLHPPSPYSTRYQPRYAIVDTPVKDITKMTTSKIGSTFLTLLADFLNILFGVGSAEERGNPADIIPR
jgi:hypothetical protein